MRTMPANNDCIEAASHPSSIDDGRSRPRRFWAKLPWPACIPIIITITLSLYQYTHTAAVTEDSVVFIRYARRCVGEFLEVVAREEHHPGYPLCLLCARQTFGR